MTEQQTTQNNQASEAQTKQYVKAYCLYWAVVTLTVLLVSAIDGTFGEHVARNWIMTMVLVLGYTNFPFKQRFLVTLLKQITLAITVFVQCYLAYGLKGYDGLDPVHPLWLLVSMVFYLSVGYAALCLSRRIEPMFNKDIHFSMRNR